MENIEFSATFGDKKKRVKLTLPTKGGNWDVLIDNFRQGSLVKLQGEWAGHLNERSQLTADDIQILGEIIDDHLRISNKK